eukprot:CAMPEP_0180511454 /NCGR_PEP_ID=MMETSP1036_2-20121128/50999_1 /TAXON_ID=632150 /ORGANISM="Azadinium spinosum, Strain 3D9" /LENGTH=142 /DNA_ID=CAMNT_0022522399 /DNA_START=401 /DNA_END=829 /DNA_ORIENTATION=-
MGDARVPCDGVARAQLLEQPLLQRPSTTVASARGLVIAWQANTVIVSDGDRPARWFPQDRQTRQVEEHARLSCASTRHHCRKCWGASNPATSAVQLCCAPCQGSPGCKKDGLLQTLEGRKHLRQPQDADLWTQRAIAATKCL